MYLYIYIYLYLIHYIWNHLRDVTTSTQTAYDQTVPNEDPQSKLVPERFQSLSGQKEWGWKGDMQACEASLVNKPCLCWLPYSNSGCWKPRRTVQQFGLSQLWLQCLYNFFRVYLQRHRHSIYLWSYYDVTYPFLLLEMETSGGDHGALLHDLGTFCAP